MKLRDYEDRDARALLSDLRAHRRVIYVLPTGCGKTVVAARVIQQYLRAGNRVLVLVHRRELVRQARDRIVADGVAARSVGTIMAGEDGDPTAFLQVASLATLLRRTMPAATLVVVDEAHHASCDKSYGRVLSWYPDAKVLGLTATPHRLNGAPLSNVFDFMREGAKPSELVRGGWLVRPRVFTKKHGRLPDLRKVAVVGGDYDKKQLAIRVNRKELRGDIVKHWKDLAAGRRTVLFAVNVAHAEKCARAFVEAGVAAEVVTGKTPTAMRDAILSPGGRLDRGATKVVCTCMVVSEGWDLPSVKCAILARPTRSTVLYLQQAGRVLRPYDESSGAMKGLPITPLILDHSGNALAHGLPHHDREWSLTQRLAKKGGGAQPTKVCPACEAIVVASATECEECGHEFNFAREIAERDGRLVEVERARAEERAAFERRVRELAAKKGVGEGWVSKVMQAYAGAA